MRDCSTLPFDYGINEYDLAPKRDGKGGTAAVCAHPTRQSLRDRHLHPYCTVGMKSCDTFSFKNIF